VTSQNLTYLPAATRDDYAHRSTRRLRRAATILECPGHVST
jgi:hypothetical protein